MKIRSLLKNTPDSSRKLQTLRVLSGNEISSNNSVVCFFKDTQSGKPVWLLMDWQDYEGTESTSSLYIALSIIPPSISPGKSCFCALSN